VDWTGTERVRSDVNGESFETCSNLPFGDAQTCTGSLEASPLHFTGKQRDTETGNDYFGARYYGSTMGRFMSPDYSETPEAMPYADLSNPQSFNRYVYLNDNPIGGIDADGHCGPGSGVTVHKFSEDKAPCKPPPPDTKRQKTAAPNKGASYAKGAVKVVGGIVAVAAVITSPEVGVAGALIGGIGGSASFVSGTTQILGTATNTDVSAGTKAVDDFGSPQGLIIGAASGGNQSLASVATTTGNIAGLAAKPQSAVGIADKIFTFTGLVTGELSTTYRTIQNMTNPSPPPTPNPPQPPVGWDQQ